ncbi:MAG: AAA family ATPase, partial [Clostridiales bacterium]|nr:AAA family ATPase [Clostridiales bacterium]
MGTYLNPSNNGFAEALRSKIYVDKTGLAGEMNGLLGTKQKYACVSRPRRFGKTMAVEMLTAYYSRGCDSRDLFASLEIAGEPSFETHLNKYNVIFLNTQSFLSRAERDADRMIALMRDELSAELRQSYSSINGLPLTRILEWIYTETGIGFIIIIDEWDCVFREKGYDKAAREAYLDFLRDLLKDRDYTALAYMTGILPIKKYGTHSALNMFSEYSMTDPQPLARYIGFTAGEVKRLCEKHSMDYGEITEWY